MKSDSILSFFVLETLKIPQQVTCRFWQHCKMQILFVPWTLIGTWRKLKHRILWGQCQQLPAAQCQQVRQDTEQVLHPEHSTDPRSSCAGLHLPTSRCVLKCPPCEGWAVPGTPGQPEFPAQPCSGQQSIPSTWCLFQLSGIAGCQAHTALSAHPLWHIHIL